MTEPRSAHATHDRLLIANLVDRSVSDAERGLAEEQLTACRDCAPALRRPRRPQRGDQGACRCRPRPRDFTLTAADAERLRVRGWRRLLAAIGSTRDAFSRPLAIGLTTLGLAGLLVATIPALVARIRRRSHQPSGTPKMPPGTRRVTRPQARRRNPELQSAASPAPSAAAESGPAIAAAAPSAAPSDVPAPAPAESSETTDPNVLCGGRRVGAAGRRTAGPRRVRHVSEQLRRCRRSARPSPMLIVAALLLRRRPGPVRPALDGPAPRGRLTAAPASQRPHAGRAAATLAPCPPNA